MFKTISLGAAALAMGATALIPTAAEAQRWHGHRYERAYGDAYADGYNRGPRYDQRRYYDRGRYNHRDRRCSSGTTGTIVGAIAGGLLGRAIDTRGDRTLGTVLGGAGGALAGHAIEKSDNPRYCR